MRIVLTDNKNAHGGTRRMTLGELPAPVVGVNHLDQFTGNR